MNHTTTTTTSAGPDTTTVATTATDTSFRSRRARRAALAVAVGLGIGAAGATSAAATGEPPIRDSGTYTFVDVNPCTNELDEYTVTEDVLFIPHDDGGVIRLKRSGSSASGYEMQRGTEIGRRNDNFERWTLRDLWHGPDGSVIQARGNFAVDLRTGEVTRDDFVLRCVGR